MPKMKTHSGCKKRFRSTASGKIKMGQAFKRHNMRKRAKNMLRESRGTTIMKECDAKRIKASFVPYGLYR